MLFRSVSQSRYEDVKQHRIDEQNATREQETNNKHYLTQLKEINNKTRKILSTKDLTDYSKSIQKMQQPLPPDFIPQKTQVNDTLLSTKIQTYFNQQINSLTRKNTTTLNKKLATKIQSHYDKQTKSITNQNNDITHMNNRIATQSQQTTTQTTTTINRNHRTTKEYSAEEIETNKTKLNIVTGKQIGRAHV